MLIFPAIDIKDRHVVRLLRGYYDQVTVYRMTPRDAARSFADAGASHLHIVDLDGAKDGTASNFAVIRDLLQSSGLHAEVGGGIRDADRIRRYLDAGADRVILGTAALENPAFLREALATFGNAIAVGVDAVNGRVATHGWIKVSEVDAFSFCSALREAGVGTLIYTDISRDGTLAGTNLDAYRRLRTIPGLRIVASGGIASYEELRTLDSMGVYAAILGKALYSGRLDLAQAILAAGGDTCHDR